MLPGLRLIPSAFLVLTACRAHTDAPAGALAAPANAESLLAAPAADATGLERYRLDRPDTVLELPAALDEISGLAWGPSGALEANQDEQGRVYRLVEGAWVPGQRFAGSGDFEGLAYAGAWLYALRSNGRLLTPQGEVDLGTPAGCDAEGLAFDDRGGRLLVACKGRSAATRAIFAWDLAARRLAPEPVIRIMTNLGRTEGRVSRLFHLDRLDRFRPSGVEVGPDGRIYVLSSQTQALAVFDRDGTLVTAEVLDRRVLPQPEGLAFGPDGTLYIASEAAGRERGTLAIFRQRDPGAP